MHRHCGGNCFSSATSMVIRAWSSPFNGPYHTIMPRLDSAASKQRHSRTISANETQSSRLNHCIDDQGIPASAINACYIHLFNGTHQVPYCSTVSELSTRYHPWFNITCHHVAFFSSLVTMTWLTCIPFRCEISCFTSSTRRTNADMGAKQSSTGTW